MACLRGIYKRVNLLQRRVYPLCGHRFGDDKDDTKPVSSPKMVCTMINKFFPHIGTERLGSVFLERQYKSFVQPLGFGLSSCRYMSSTPAEFSEKFDGIDFGTTEVVPDEILESINEVAIAAADSAFPIAAIQHLINGVHSVTGLNWWADIALTTLIINGLTLPILLYQTKTFQKIDIFLRPQLEQLRQEMSTKASDPEAMAKEVRKQDEILYKRYGVNKSTLLATFIFQGSFFLSFTFAILDMAHKVPSFKTGGTLWFIDLTTPDSTFSLHILTTLTFGILGAQLLFKDAGAMYRDGEYVYKICLPLLLLLTLYLRHLENAVACYWLTSNLFFIGYGVVIRRLDIWKLLNLSDVTTVSLTPSTSSSFRPFSSRKKKNKK